MRELRSGFAPEAFEFVGGEVSGGDAFHRVVGARVWHGAHGLVGLPDDATVDVDAGDGLGGRSCRAMSVNTVASMCTPPPAPISHITSKGVTLTPTNDDTASG